MTFIESPINENEQALAQLVKDSHIPTRGKPASVIHFGRVIVWKNRTFRELCLPPTPDSLEQENTIFSNFQIPRARIMLGSVRGVVFTTPPEAGGEPAARIKEGGRCAPEYLVKPFHYTDYRPEIR